MSKLLFTKLFVSQLRRRIIPYICNRCSQYLSCNSKVTRGAKRDKSCLGHYTSASHQLFLCFTSIWNKIMLLVCHCPEIIYRVIGNSIHFPREVKVELISDSFCCFILNAIPYILYMKFYVNVCFVLLCIL